MIAMSFDVIILLLTVDFTSVEAGIFRRQSNSNSLEDKADATTEPFVTGDAGREPHFIHNGKPSAAQQRIHAVPGFVADIGGVNISYAMETLKNSSKILRSAPSENHGSLIRADEKNSWFPNEGFKGMIIEVVLSCVAFVFISITHKRLRCRDRQPGSVGKTSSANKKKKIVTLVPPGVKATQKAPADPAHQIAGSVDFSNGGASTRKASTPDGLGGAETIAFVEALKSGRTGEISRLLATLKARAEARGDELAGLEDRILATALRMCAAHHCFKEALAAYDFWADAIGDVRESKGIWSVLLYAAASSGNFVRCQSFYDKVCEEGRPSCHDFVNIVRALAHHQDLNGLCTAIDGIRNQNSCELDAFTRNRALATCVSENAVELAATLLATDVFMEQPDAVAYNTVMKGFSRQGQLERCFQLFSEMRANGLSPSEKSFGILLDACVRAEDFDKARAVCQDLRQSGFRLNAVLWTTCIKGLVGAGRLDEAATMLEDMQLSPDAKPDLITYSILVKAYADRGCVGDALKTVHAMITWRVKPDEIILNSVLSACIHSPVSSTEAFHVFDTLQKLGLRPSAKSLSTLLKILTHNSDYELALKFLEEVPQRCCGVQVETRLFAQIAQAAAQAQQGEHAVAAFEAMCDTLRQRDEILDSAIYDRLLRHCMHCGQHAAAKRLREAARRVELSRPLRDAESGVKFACKANAKPKQAF